jgi:hypothetical protein
VMIERAGCARRPKAAVAEPVAQPKKLGNEAAKANRVPNEPRNSQVRDSSGSVSSRGSSGSDGSGSGSNGGRDVLVIEHEHRRAPPAQAIAPQEKAARVKQRRRHGSDTDVGCANSSGGDQRKELLPARARR